MPADAKILDGRPGKEVVAIFDRINGRVAKSLPAGLVAITAKTQMKNRPAQAILEVVELAGQNWGSRKYRLKVDDVAGDVSLPNDWAGAGGDPLLRALGGVAPYHVFRSNGVEAFDADIDPTTGAETHPNNGGGRGAPKSLPGPARRTGIGVRVEYAGPASQLYPMDTGIGRYIPGSTLDLVTSPDRPGLVGIWVRTYEDAGGAHGLWMDKTYWIDPQHDDRPVNYTITHYNPATHQISGNETTEFSNYATLPTPNGRSYPTQWTLVMSSIEKDGKATEGIRVTTTFHIFPGKALPALPKKPEGLP